MIDILLATYNGAPYLREQLDSLLAQSYPHWRVLIHDDGSEDATLSIVYTYAQRDERIVVIEDGIRCGSARDNFAHLLSHSDASYGMFCDQDDVWLPHKIEASMAAMRTLEAHHRGALLVHSDVSVVDATLKMIDPSLWHLQHNDPRHRTLARLLLQNIFTGSTLLFNASLRTLATPIPREAIMHDWWMGMVASRFGHIMTLQDPTLWYRQHTTNDVGAVHLGWKHILHKLLTPTPLRDHYRQAHAFLDRFGEHLTPAECRMLHAFIDLPYRSYTIQRWQILRYRWFKHSLGRNMAFFLSPLGDS